MTYARLKKLITKGAYEKRGYAEQIRCILDGEQNHRGAVSGTHWHDGVML